MSYIVTVKRRNPNHDPRNKQTGICLVSDICTDKTGHHHSLLVEANSIKRAEEIIKEKYNNIHITRIEEV